MPGRSVVWHYCRVMFDLSLHTVRLVPTVVWLALGATWANAAPITAGTPSGDAPPAPIWSRFSDQEIVGGGPSSGTLVDTWRLYAPGEAILPDASLPALGNFNMAGAKEDGPGIVSSLRGLANVAPSSPAPGRGSAQRSRGNDPLTGVDLGPEARQWVQGAFRNIVDSVLELDVDQSGRASFSVLGLRGFGIAVSGDRNQIAFLSGDHVLMTAERDMDPTQGIPAGGAASGSPVWQPVPSAPAAWSDRTLLRKAFELLLEMATHPLSLLVYLIIASYILLWNVMNRPRRSRSRSRSARHAEPHPASSPAKRTRKRRHRVRRHHHA